MSLLELINYLLIKMEYSLANKIKVESQEDSMDNGMLGKTLEIS